MKSVLVVSAIGLLMSGAALAADDDDDEFYKTKNCFACHRVDRHHHGPTFRAIAAKYADDKAAEGRLVKKVREGGVGVWGQTPMPAQAQVTEAEALRLVRWVLQQK